MRLLWLEREERRSLLLYFNGWGMDERPVEHLAAPPGHDVLMAHDYTDLRGGEALGNVLKGYGSVTLVAWSMGVWAAASLLRDRQCGIGTALAINGTCRPIDPHYGIPPGIFRATLDGFSEDSRESFFRRMCGGREETAFFTKRAPRRGILEQQMELKALEEQTRCPTVSAALFTRAVIGRRDRIVPMRNQHRFWAGRTPFRVVDLPHYPFFHWRGWEEALEAAADDQ